MGSRDEDAFHKEKQVKQSVQCRQGRGGLQESQGYSAQHGTEHHGCFLYQKKIRCGKIQGGEQLMVRPETELFPGISNHFTGIVAGSL